MSWKAYNTLVRSQCSEHRDVRINWNSSEKNINHLLYLFHNKNFLTDRPMTSLSFLEITQCVAGLNLVLKICKLLNTSTTLPAPFQFSFSKLIQPTVHKGAKWPFIFRWGFGKPLLRIQVCIENKKCSPEKVS